VLAEEAVPNVKVVGGEPVLPPGNYGPVAPMMATLLGLVPPYLGPILYLLFRPSETLEDVRARRVELQALEQHLDARSQPTCPVCCVPVEAAHIQTQVLFAGGETNDESVSLAAARIAVMRATESDDTRAPHDWLFAGDIREQFEQHVRVGPFLVVLDGSHETGYGRARRTKKPFGPGVALIADAAGYNDPIIGEGLSLCDARRTCPQRHPAGRRRLVR